MRLADLAPEPLPRGLDLTEEVVAGPGSLGDVPGVIARWCGARPLPVADPETWRACPLETGTPWLTRSKPHATRALADELRHAAAGRTGLVAVGAGTINDIAKLAAFELDLPYVVVATAASMNGFASGIAAILDRGVKTTVPARPPRAIVLDTEVLRDAPPEMARAGLGDLISKPVSNADWWLASELAGERFDDLPGRIVDRAMERAVTRAAGLADGDPAAFAALGEALVLSGASMVVAGSSSPASGGEHLLSHLWDMEAIAAGREPELHGAQVGVATCITAALFALLADLEDPTIPDPPSSEAETARIRRDHGALADAVLPHAASKHAGAADRARTLRARWPELRAGLAARRIPTAETLRGILEAARAPARLADIGRTHADAVRALANARDIRARYTVLDLAWEVGLLPQCADRLLT